MRLHGHRKIRRKPIDELNIEPATTLWKHMAQQTWFMRHIGNLGNTISSKLPLCNPVSAEANRLKLFRAAQIVLHPGATLVHPAAIAQIAKVLNEIITRSNRQNR